MAETYDVVLLVEENLTPEDATRIRSLHEGIEDPVAYHVLMPTEDGRARVQAALGASADLSPDLMPSRPVMPLDVDPQAIVEEARAEVQRELTNAVKVLRDAGAQADGELVDGDPVDALADKIKAVDGREAIVLTEEHFVAELLRLDWASKARRRLEVPVLHLMEQENFDEQAGGGEGASLI